jgi:hypothetical protein
MSLKARSFDSHHFLQAPPMPLLTGEGRLQECPDQFSGKFGADDARTQTEHVHVIMFDTLMGRVRIMA